MLRIGHDADEEAENRERRLLIEVLFCSLCDETPRMYSVRIYSTSTTVRSVRVQCV